VLPRLGWFAIVFLVLNGICSAQTAAPFSCPATLVVAEQPRPTPGWSGASGNNEHRFKTVSVYNGHSGKEEYELKPNDESKQGHAVTLSWRLKDYRDMNLFVRCFYYDTQATITADLPARLSTCSVSLQLDAKNEITGRSTMSCR
jgi:hypothetical protein